MKNYLWLLLVMTLLASCKEKKDKGNDDNIPPELFSAYKTMKLPFYAVDSTMEGKATDTTISLKIFTAYFPDSVFNTPFGNNRKLTIMPVGKIVQSNKESYLATFVKNQNKSALYLSVFDSGHHIVTMPVVINSEDSGNYINSVSVDKKLTIVLNKEWMVKNDLFYKRNIFAYNNIGVFTTVLTETNEQHNTATALVNPLDTFPKKNKYSGEYAKGTKNQLFIRDGGSPGDYLFFVHFETGENDERCGGELRGKFKMTDETSGQYANVGDPCGLTFTFKGNEAMVKENGSCGNYRDIKCFFNDTYTKKKEVVKKKR